jgi:hypothetical protein
MGFNRILQCLLLTLMPIYLVTGCGDLEPEMQDTRTVILNMDFDQRSSSRTSRAELINVDPYQTHINVDPYQTHLIMVMTSENIELTSGEYLSNSNYLDYRSNNKVEEYVLYDSDRTITLNMTYGTKMKIFAFLFRENYSIGGDQDDNLFSANRDAGYYGESQIITIDDLLSIPANIILKEGSGTDTAGGYGLDTTELEGTWETACYAKSDNTKSTIETLTFAGNALTSKVEDHSDTSCATDYSLEEWPFTFFIGDAVTFANGKTGHKFTLIVPSTYKITPQSALAVSTFNSESKCSASDWELNTEKECSNGDAGDTVYCLYQLDGNTGYPKCDSSSYPSTSDIQTDNASSTFVKQ